MKIDYTGRGTEVTPALKGALTKQLAKMESRGVEMQSVHAIFSVQKQRQSVELIIKARRKQYVCKGESGDMYASIDAAGEAFMQQIKKLKESAQSQHRHAATRRRPASAVDEIEMATPEEAPEVPKVTRITQTAQKPMSLKMATLLLAAQKEPVLTFTNVDTGRLAVLFRRAAGGYGLLEP